MDTPLVSILMPLYNGEAFVEEAIESILAESYVNFELLICDDASTDRSRSIAQGYAARDARIRLSTREQNSGSLSVVSRSLIADARGEYLIVSDSDDVAMPRRLEMLVSLAERHPEASVVYGTVHSVSEDLSTLLKVYEDPFCPFRLFQGNFIPDGGSLIRKTAYDAVGGYDPEVIWAEDYELRLRLATFGPMIHQDELVYLYRQHGQSWTAQRKDNTEEKSFKQRLLRQEQKTVDSICAGHITCYRDAVIAAYYLASVEPSIPRCGTQGFPWFATRVVNRLERSTSHLMRRAARKLVNPLMRFAVTAWKHNRLSRPAITRPALEDALIAAGLEGGDQAMVHCSMSSLGWVSGGASTVVDTLTSIIGVSGRLIMPTFTYQCDLGATEPANPPPVSRRYRQDLPCSKDMGVVAEAFRCRPDTHRVNHPGLSFAVWGEGAENFAARHQRFDNLSQLSPVGELYHEGKIVMIGTDFETTSLCCIWPNILPRWRIKNTGIIMEWLTSTIRLSDYEPPVLPLPSPSLPGC